MSKSCFQKGGRRSIWPIGSARRNTPMNCSMDMPFQDFWGRKRKRFHVRRQALGSREIQAHPGSLCDAVLGSVTNSLCAGEHLNLMLAAILVCVGLASAVGSWCRPNRARHTDQLVIYEHRRRQIITGGTHAISGLKTRHHKRGRVGVIVGWGATVVV